MLVSEYLICSNGYVFTIFDEDFTWDLGMSQYLITKSR